MTEIPRVPETESAKRVRSRNKRMLVCTALHGLRDGLYPAR